MKVELKMGDKKIDLSGITKGIQKSIGIKPIKGCPNDGMADFQVCGQHVFVPSVITADGMAPAHSAIRLDTYFCKRSVGHKGAHHSHDYLKNECLLVWDLKINKALEVKKDDKVGSK